MLSVMASVVLSRRLEQLGAWLRFSQSLMGIVAALGADAPEISSAITALHGGHHDLGLGIVFGSNIFNLAALLGLSAVISRQVRVTRRTLLFNGTVAVIVMAVVTMQLYGLITGPWAIGVCGLVMLSYVTITAIPPRLILKYFGRYSFGLDLEKVVEGVDRDSARAETAPQPSTADLLGSLPALVTIIVASIGMVRAALSLGNAWHVPEPIIGTLILAALTGIPNVVTSVRLAMRGRGSAVLSEGLNSNTLNLIVGVSITLMLLGVGKLSSAATISLWWMIGMTALALVLSYFRGGMGRKGGTLLIAIYIGFVIMVIVRA